MINTQNTFTAALVVLGLGAFGCTGTIAESGDRQGRDPGGPDDEPVDNFDPDAPKIDPVAPMAPPVPAEASVSTAPLLRLNPVELRNTLEDLFGAAGIEEYPFKVTDSAALTNPVSGVDAVRFFNLADAVAKRVYKGDRVMLCMPGQMTAAACNEHIARTVGKRVFRRPLTEAEVTRYVAAANASTTFDIGVRVMLTSMLGSAKFLYRATLDNEGVAPNTTRPLSGYETASRLSYALWQSMPDAELFDAADKGLLGSEEQVRDQARRMLDHGRAREVVASFHGWWLRVENNDRVFRDAKIYPGFNNGTTQAQWIDETRTFTQKTVFDGGGTLVDLFTAPHTYAHADIAGIYGGTPDASGKVALPENQRAGVLTQGTLLAPYADHEQASAIYRGANLYRGVLCGELPPPPMDVPKLAEDKTASVRVQVELGTGAGECKACHQLFNNMGFALGNFDGIGRWTDVDINGKAIDTKVTLNAPEDLAGVEVEGAAGLGKVLGGSASLRDCYVDKWFEFLTGRRYDVENGDQYSMLSTQFQFETAKRDVRGMLVEMVSSMAFRHVRTPAL